MTRIVSTVWTQRLRSKIGSLFKTAGSNGNPRSLKFCKQSERRSFSTGNKFSQSSTNTSNNGSRLMFGVGAAIGLVGFGVWWESGAFSSVNAEEDCSADVGMGAERMNSSRCSVHCSQNVNWSEAINKARVLIERLQAEVGFPGLVIGVSVNGEQVWKEGFGYADLENRVPCSPETVVRIASISKPITMAIVARLLEEKKLDLDVPIQEYLPSFPEKTFNDKKVIITLRHLVSQLGGIRHYSKTKPGTKQPAKNDQKDNNGTEYDLKEYHIKNHFSTVADSVRLFQDDPLLCEPGKEFLYTTHGWTLISAIVEAATKEPFTKSVLKLAKDLDMSCTYLDENEPLIYNRSRYYHKNKKGRIVNEPYVDLSYKWAGGGLLSTVGDLLKFANAMLYSYQYTSPNSSTNGGKNNSLDSLVDGGNISIPGCLKPETLSLIWTPVENTECSWDKDGKYAMGWGVIPAKQDYGACRDQRFYVTHTGGAIGASSVLLILPPKEVKSGAPPPQGVSVAILVNLRSVGVNKVGLEIAKIFEEAGK